MKKPIELKDAVGRQVAAVRSGGYLDHFVIVFTDGEYCAIGCDNGYDGEGSTPEDCHDTFDPRWSIPTNDAISLGLITQQEADDYRNEQEAIQKKRTEANERATLERLRAKYETGQ